MPFRLPHRDSECPGKHFVNEVFTGLTQHYVVVHKRNTAYYPQANGLAESTNKTLKGIFRKIVNAHKKNWDCKLRLALWAYKTIFLTSIGTTPFRLAFGLEAVMPIQFETPTLCIQIQERLPKHESQLIRAEEFLALDEQRLDSECRVERDQLWWTAFVDRHSQRDRATLQEGPPVLVFSSCSGLMPNKLKLR